MAVRLSPRNAAMLYNLAIVLAKQGRVKESRQWRERAMKVDPRLYTGKDYSKRGRR
jgi:Flp pilus assembly protein TadD